MKKSFWILFSSVLVTGIAMAVNSNRISFEEYESLDLKKVTANDDFNKMMDVLSHKRCVNCHPNDNVPKQGEDSHPHYFDMKRGEENLGFQATKCTTCHQSENNEYSGVPGAPHWSLAPASMMWEGLSRVEIAESMMDPIRNGNRSAEDILHHLTEDELVLWAFNPGVDADGVPREKPPLTKEDYIMAVKNWFAAGAVIPKP
ncbi:hypothetical protein [Maribacter hydrothermalis]|uniref:Cytochrome c domain-containing protein n=1 Tax=Maribacter hydrothermalis TaxID=1836467 RepID=A0A1B7Z7X8_9FLAO|nr:hypothetical protein [Maribacter hydrothermalis]APQ19172.1 hypothetical protein BTR34_18405 [Maribacter hydrothermalis]OBR38817.1 hypothetical protein A9200_03880 [Maribacter hydrothermalis]